jgi:ribosomal protein L12E/L44/L45/RPP1/RPP2
MAELAVVYSSLILHDGGAELSAENMKKLCDAANVSVEGIIS